MINTTTLTMTTAASSAGSKEIPFWVYIIWAVAGLLFTITVIVVICFCVYNSRKKIKNGSRPPPSHHMNDVDELEAYDPQRIITQFNGIGGQTKHITSFSTSFVHHTRIPRAMEVKMAKTVSHMNSSFTYAYNAPALPQTSGAFDSLQMPEWGDQQFLSALDIRGYVSPPPGERKAPSRQSSFLLQEIMDDKERADRIKKEKMLVYELREKLRRQGKFEEE